MTAAHTPGPWKALDANGHYDNRENSWTVCDDEAASSSCAPITLADGEIVAFAACKSDLHTDDDEVLHANARLIAAAPDLLMALEMLYGDTADYIRLNNLGGMDNQCMKLARAAIAAATSQPPKG